ncbi:MAG: hypothetical protein H7319_16515 [Spirosoma sp.]|nr:hypothetical protein [Spirosoma sp.]
MRQLAIQIPKPCPERWDGMQPTEQGRFCANCQKAVVDYTALSDRELLRLFSQPVVTTCGRFRDDQLNRTLVLSDPIGVSVWQRWVGLLTMGLFGWHITQGQSVQTRQVSSQTVERPYFSVAEIPVRPTAGSGAELVVSGRVVLADSGGNLSPVSADVMISGTRKLWLARTDSSGAFVVTIPHQTEITELKVRAYTSDRSRGQIIFNASPSDRSITLDDVVIYAPELKANITAGGICLVKSPSRWQKFWQKLF